MKLRGFVFLVLFFHIDLPTLSAFEQLFGVVRLFSKVIPPPPVSLIRNNKNHVLDGVVSSVRRDIEEVEREALSASQIDDQFERGINHITDTVYLVGVRQRAMNVSRFCGALADRQLRDIQMPTRDGIIYRPTVPLNGRIVNVSLAVPRSWFRESPRPNHRKEFRVFICYEGETQLILMPLTVYQSDLQTDDKHFVFNQKNKLDEYMTIREIALILDGHWNNAYLLPRNMKSTIQIHTEELKRRPTYSHICDPKKGLDQPCCLWPFSSKILFGPSNKVKEVTFYRCVGHALHEVHTFPFMSEQNAMLLQHGGMTRRFLFRKDKVCRESRFRPIALSVNEPTGTYTKKLYRLDATECSIYY